MANEISTSVALSVSKGGASVSITGNQAFDLAGSEMISAVQSFTTSEAAISLGGVATLGKLAIKNMDGTNDLTVGMANPITTTTRLSTIKPGGTILVSGVTATLYGKSSAGTVLGFIVAVEP